MSINVELVGKTANGNFCVIIDEKVVVLPLGGLEIPTIVSPFGCWHTNSNWGEIDDQWWEDKFPEYPKQIGYQSNLSEQEKQLRIKNSELYKQVCEQLEILISKYQG